jgi:hypothetical protein
VEEPLEPVELATPRPVDPVEPALAVEVEPVLPAEPVEPIEPALAAAVLEPVEVDAAVPPPSGVGPASLLLDDLEQAAAAISKQDERSRFLMRGMRPAARSSVKKNRLRPIRDRRRNPRPGG